MDAEERWRQARNILCIRLDTLGDVLMTGPALRALKQAVPGRHISLLTSPAGADVAALMPGVDRVLTYEAPWMKASPERDDSQADLAMVARLRDAHFDAAVIFTVYSQNPLPAALLCYLADIRLRLAHCRENPYQLLTDWVREVEPEQGIRHEVRRQLDLVATVGCRLADERLALRVPGPDRRRVHRLLQRLGLGQKGPWVLIHPGASAASRRYPPASFAVVARRLAQDEGLPVVFSGTEPERALVEGIRAAMGAPSHSLAGQVSLGELAALIEAAPLMISNNTGPAHVAAAVGTPVVDLYALTNPQHQPWQVPNRVLFHDVPCKFCYKSVCPQGHHNCLRLVAPGEVVRAAMDLLAETGDRLPGPQIPGKRREQRTGSAVLAPEMTT